MTQQYVGEVIARISADVTGLRAGVTAANASLHSMSTAAAASSKKSNASLFTIETQAQRTGKRIDQMGLDFHKASSSAAGSIKKATSSLDSLNAGVNKVGQSVGHMGAKMATAMLAASGLQTMVVNMVQAAKSAIIDYNSQIEQATIGFTTMLGSAESANRELRSLEDFAARTPFEFTGLISATQRLLAFGFAIQEVRPALTSVGDFVAGIGGSMEMQGQQVIRALGQIRAKGRVQAEEMLQLTEAGVGAWQYLADTIGISTAEVMEQSRKGMITASQATSAILEGLSRDFGGMMEGQSKTLMGAMSTVKDYVRKTAGDMTKPIYEMTRDAVLKAADWLSSDKIQASASLMSKRIAKAMDSGFASISSAAKQLAPMFSMMKEALISAAPAGSAVASSLGDVFTVALQVGVEIANIVAQLNQFAGPLVIGGLKLLATVLGGLSDLFAKNTWLVKMLAAAFVGLKLANLANDIKKMVFGWMASIRASYSVAGALKVQQAAVVQLTGAQTALNLAQSAGATGLASSIVAQNAKMANGLTGLASKTKAGAGAIGGLSSKLSGLSGAGGYATAAVAGISIGLALMAVNAQSTAEAIDKAVAKATEGAGTVEEKMAGLDAALAGHMKSNRDLQYSGGFWSDMGGGISNVFSGGWLTDDGDSTSKSEEAFIKEQNKLQAEYMTSQKQSNQEIIEQAWAFADEYQLALAETTDGINKEMAKTLAAEQAGFQALLDPMKMFGEQEQVSYDDMLKNMQDNNKRLGEWKTNLQYLLSTGNEDLAAFFADLGPTSLQAMNDMIQSGDFAGLRKAMTDGMALTGEDAESAMLKGLSNIPTMAEAVGIDVLGRLELMARNAAHPALALNAVYEETLDQLKANSAETIAKMFNGAELQDEGIKKKIDELSAAFSEMDPKTLVGAGLTPEALGIPAVQAELGALATMGVTDPMVINSNIAALLSELGTTQVNIDNLIRPPVPFTIAMRSPALQTALERSNGLHDQLLDITGQEWTVPMVIKWSNTTPPVIKAVVPGFDPNLNTGNDTMDDLLGYNKTKKADGGFLPGAARIQQAGTLVQWAEPSTGGEAFIPLSPTKRDRSLEIWGEVGKRLDVFGNGGFREPDWDTRSQPLKPAPVYTGGSGKKSSGKKSGGGGGGSAPPDLWGIFKTMYEYGDQTDAAMLEQAQTRLASAKKYSDEWKEAYGLLETVQAKIAGDAQQMNEWKLMIGEMSVTDYEKNLKERLDASTKFTDEWADLWQQWDAVEKARVEEERRTQDNMVTVGDMSNADFLVILNERIAGLTKYSDEWTALWQQIQGINDAAAADAESLVAVFDGIGQSMADAFSELYDSVAGPLNAATSVISAFANEEYIQFDQLLGFYDNVTEASQRWQDALEELASLGLNEASYTELAQSGPEALQLAEAIIAAGADGVAQLNAAAASVAAINAQTGVDYAGSAPTTQIGTQLTIGNITIDLTGSTLTEDQVRDMLDQAFGELIAQVSLAS